MKTLEFRGLSPRPRSMGTAAVLAAAFLALAATNAAAGDKGRAFKLDARGVVNQSNFSLSVSGQATHLGRFTAVGQITENVPDPENPGFFLRSGYLVFTAANGDTLNFLFDDAVVNGTTGFALGAMVVDGGTGRFRNATGEIPFFVTQQSISDPSFRLVIEGRIDY